jgi:hypothetical protein
VDPDPDPYPQGSETFCRIRIRISNGSVLDPDPAKNPKVNLGINKITKKVAI